MPEAGSVILTTADGLRLSASYFSPHEPTIAYVVAHGFTGSATSAAITAIRAQLAAAGHAVLAVDARGHGRSEGYCTLGDRETADIAAAVAFLRLQHPQAAVVTLGFSMGAATVIRHAGLGGDTDVVVSVSSPGYWWERSTRPMRILEWVVTSPTGRRLTRVFKGVRVGTGWDEEPAQPVDVIGAITVGVLIVHGERDHYFPLRHPRALAAAAPAAQLWIEEEMGHAEDATSADLIARIDAWVASVLGEGAPGRAT